MYDIFVYIFLFAIGASIGSFINVVVSRYDTKLSLFGRSQCVFCKHKLFWYELIPLISFAIQKGRCSSCKKKISWHYPSVELITGIVFILIFLQSFPLIYLPYAQMFIFSIYIFIAGILIAISSYDIKHKIIPDEFVFAFIVATVVFILFDGFILQNTINLTDIMAGPILFLPFAALWFFSNGEWMGFGDAKLAWGMGWFLGLSQGTVAIIFAFWIGAVFSLLLIALSKIFRFVSYSKQVTIKSEVPFAPFLILGLFIAWFTGMNAIDLISFFNF